MFRHLWILWHKMRELKRNAHLSRTELTALKLAKFRKLAAYVQRRSAYYREVMAERGLVAATCTPEDFPVLTKSLVMQHFDRIATDPRITREAVGAFLRQSKDPHERFLGQFQVLHTSGSSGEVGIFVYSSRDWLTGMAHNIRRRLLRLPGRGLRRMRVAFFGATDSHYAGVSMAGMARSGVNRLLVDMRVYEINAPLPQLIEQLNDFQPDYLAGYTTALKILAEQQRAGRLHIAPQRIECGGEAVTTLDKATLHQAFGATVLSVYGCTEHLVMGTSVPGESTMVLHDDDLIYELHEDHCLVTNLFNFTLPLIRYRMSDVLRPAAGGAAGPYLLIESLVGRAELVPQFVNARGTRDCFSPHTINELSVRGVRRFQLRMLSDTSFRFVVCLEQALDHEQHAAAVADITQRLRVLLAEKDMQNVGFEVQSVGELPLNPRTRKFDLIVDERKLA